LVQRVVRKRGQRGRIDGLVFHVERVGLQHVFAAVQMPVL
jgi:hypothetical protein